MFKSFFKKNINIKPDIEIRLIGEKKTKKETRPAKDVPKSVAKLTQNLLNRQIFL